MNSKHELDVAGRQPSRQGITDSYFMPGPSPPYNHFALGIAGSPASASTPRLPHAYNSQSSIGSANRKGFVRGKGTPRTPAVHTPVFRKGSPFHGKGGTPFLTKGSPASSRYGSNITPSRRMHRSAPVQTPSSRSSKHQKQNRTPQNRNGGAEKNGNELHENARKIAENGVLACNLPKPSVIAPNENHSTEAEPILVETDEITPRQLRLFYARFILSQGRILQRLCVIAKYTDASGQVYKCVLPASAIDLQPPRALGALQDITREDREVDETLNLNPEKPTKGFKSKRDHTKELSQIQKNTDLFDFNWQGLNIGNPDLRMPGLTTPETVSEALSKNKGQTPILNNSREAQMLGINPPLGLPASSSSAPPNGCKNGVNADENDDGNDEAKVMQDNKEGILASLFLTDITTFPKLLRVVDAINREHPDAFGDIFCLRLQNCNPVKILGPNFPRVALSFGIVMYRGIFGITTMSNMYNLAAWIQVMNQMSLLHKARRPRLLVLREEMLRQKLAHAWDQFVHGVEDVSNHVIMSLPDIDRNPVSSDSDDDHDVAASSSASRFDPRTPNINQETSASSFAR